MITKNLLTYKAFVCLYVMARKLLLDFDGVVLKNQRLKQYQLDRSASFVRKTTNIKLASCKDLNAKYYPRYGHTVTMLRKMFNKKVTLEEYNEYLYSPTKLRWLKRFIDKDTFEHGHGFNDVFRFCNDNHIGCYIFTNVHIDWVVYFSELMGLSIEQKNVIWPSHLELLKPRPAIYDTIQEVFEPSSRFYFVDDSETNLVIPRQMGWKTLAFNERSSVDDIIEMF